MATLYAEREDVFDKAAEVFLNAVEIGPQPPESKGLILGRVEKS